MCDDDGLSSTPSTAHPSVKAPPRRATAGGRAPVSPFMSWWVERRRKELKKGEVKKERDKSVEVENMTRTPSGNRGGRRILFLLLLTLAAASAIRLPIERRCSLASYSLYEGGLGQGQETGKSVANAEAAVFRFEESPPALGAAAAVETAGRRASVDTGRRTSAVCRARGASREKGSRGRALAQGGAWTIAIVFSGLQANKTKIAKK